MLKTEIFAEIDSLIAEISARVTSYEVVEKLYRPKAKLAYSLALEVPCMRRIESARKIIKPIDERLAKFKKTFCDYLLDYISERGMSEVDVYKKARLDRRIFSKIRNAENYMPSKRTVLAIALAMELNIDEAQELLHKGGFALSPADKKDVVMSYFFENRIYDLFTINEVLDHYGFKLFN